MDWSRFDAHGEDKPEAFEAFAGQLFERWCRKEYAGELRQVRIVDGRGGDGGVDAYAVLASGEVVGLQAKWFPGRLGSAQIKQIHDSFERAITVRERLVRYCVALPCALTERDSDEKSGWKRWSDWIARAAAMAPGVEVHLWDEAKLRALLCESENEGLHAYWFPDSVLSRDDLTQRFAAARRGWLNLRYVPDHHAIGRLEEDLALRLGEPEARAKILRRVKEATTKLEALREDVARLARLSAFRRDVPDAEQLRGAALDALGRMIDAGKALEDALCRASPLPEHMEPSEHDEEHLRRLAGVLLGLERDRFHAPTRGIREHLDRVVDTLGHPSSSLREAWARWRGARLLGAYVGAPGVGKTQGLAHAVEERLNRGLPAVILRARDCPVEEGWEEILRKALDQPRSRLPEILNAMEATAVRAEARRARASARTPDDAADVQGPGEQPGSTSAHHGGTPAHEGGVEPEPVCLLLAIDGLEEAGKHRRWAELLGELSTHLERHPRLRAAVTLRTASREAILGRVRVDLFQEIPLPTGGEVDALLQKTCRAMEIQLPDRRVRWAIREPLSVRLYCELSRQRPAAAWGARPQDVSLAALLSEKLRRVEEELQDRWEWSRRVPLREALTALAEARLERGGMRRDDAIEVIRAAVPPAHALSTSDAGWLLDQAKEYGLLTEWPSESDDPYAPPIQRIELAFEPLVDHLIARRVCDAAQDALARGETPPFPEVLRDRRDALTQVAILLAQNGISLVRSGLFRDELPHEEIERLELRAVAALDDGAARAYREWVLERLQASMPSCRRVLAELCVPAARDVSHPFGPRFVHEALLPLLPARRDQFWSGPRHLPGDSGQPWEGSGDGALEELTLAKGDPADGPPLLLAWALTSVITGWRRRLRAELARWAASDVGELIRWLDLVIHTNDPQMAEDVVTVAFGAACLTGAHPSLAQLVGWVDRQLLAPDAPHRREDVAVLHAARGIVERARALGVAVDPVVLERARRFYAPTGEMFPFDGEAARAASDRHGVEPVSTRFAWYVVPPAIDPFFRRAGSMDLHMWSPEHAEKLDPRAAWILRAHAEQSQISALSPLRFAFGALVAHLRAVGWNEADFYGDSSDEEPAVTVGMDVAIARYYGEAGARGEVSPVCTVAEKYIRTGCRQMQAYLAARAPAEGHGAAQGAIEPPVDPVRIAQLDPNPASDAVLDPSGEDEPWALWADDGLVSPRDLGSQDQVARAVEWVRTAPPPDIEPWLRIPRGAAPRLGGEEKDEWITLWGEIRARERESQADSTLWIGSAVVAQRDAALLVAHARSIDPSTIGHLCEDGELACHGVDPAEAMWAPWAEERIEAYEIPMGGRAIELTSASVEAGYHGLGAIGRSCRLPARWLRGLLDLVGAKSLGGGANWCFTDRDGCIQAVYAHRSTEQIPWQKALVVRRRALERALANRGQRLVWGIRLRREPAPGIIDAFSSDAPPAQRYWLWFAAMGESSAHDPGSIDVVLMPGSGSVRGTVEPETASPPASARCSPFEPPAGPGTPELATPLSSDLDDDQAIPYFLWDDPIPVSEVRHRLKSASPPERDRLLGKILREAQDTDVWRFTTPEEVAARFSQLARHLGRRKRFWEFLLKLWHKEGLLEQEPA